MTSAELIAWLQKNVAPDTQVMILDGFNGGGFPIDINLKSHHRVVKGDVEHTADCEGMIGKLVAVLGYGCY